MPEPQGPETDGPAKKTVKKPVKKAAKRAALRPRPLAPSSTTLPS